jgi:aryl-alcohol dehydrogenase-like predicted oxidoreductase
MEYKRLGRTNLNVSCIGFGGAPMGLDNYLEPYQAEKNREEVISALHTALDQGINYIDTAPGYGNGLGERFIGEVLNDRRKEAYIATKVSPHLDYDDIIRSVESSLKNLKTDYIDVMQFHGGYLSEGDYKRIVNDGPLDALRDCQRQGKIRFIGITNEVSDHILLWSIYSGCFDVIQVRYNLFYQGASDPIIPEASKHDVGVVIMRPLTSQSLYRFLMRVAPEALLTINPHQIALDFVLSNPNVSVAICGMRTTKEVLDNVNTVDKKEWLWEYRLDRGQGGIQF